MDKLYIVMPAYNEAENIEETVNQWRPVAERVQQEGNVCQLVVADDGSKDNTFSKMCELQGAYPLFTPLTKPNSGHGQRFCFCITMPYKMVQHTYFKPTAMDRHCQTSFGRCGKTVKHLIFKSGQEMAEKMDSAVLLLQRFCDWLFFLRLAFG